MERTFFATRATHLMNTPKSVSCLLGYSWVMLTALMLVNCSASKTPSGHYQQEKFNDVAYGVHSRQVMDVYLPANRTTHTAFVILIHGGAWVKAGKEYVRDIQDTLLKHGIAVASINHRYANQTDVHYPQMLEDVNQAMTYCSTHAAQWHTRPDGFVLVGASSGAHLALLTAYTTPKTIRAVVDFSGPTNLADTTLLNYAQKVGLIEVVQMMTGKSYVKGTLPDPAFAQASPLTQVKAIPVLMIHGTADVVVPYAQSEVLEGKLSSMGIKHKLLAIPNAGHDLSMNDSKIRALVLNTAVEWVLTYGQ
ncbi:alpha/beta hydrolase [Spirosoma validum]|uniref:Alpha/beta hydrolase n=1 Tax=Spirosoma validum TaxID=2771355 RepID=A0A927GEX4_9BACT|nr:alpha/beta hydrolase [Spirosoma validum]MBD2755272.1 alpha/beta hydrolase [Spirosoma validum]